MDYPVGIENTSNLLLQVGEFFGLSGVKRVVDDETREVVRRIEPLIEPYFIRLKAAFSGDPVLYNSIKSALSSLGVRFEIVVIVNTSDKRAFLKENGDNIIFEPTMNRLVDIGLSEEQIEPIGLFIGNSDMSPYFIASGKATVEIGFPSYFSHSIACEPYIGYKGFLHLISRIVKELRYAEVRKVFRDIKR
jgi:nitrogenase molybdenum-iron protein alpha/beta subunit